MALTPERSEKLCRKCETVKPFTEFSRAAKYKDGLQTQCKACAAAHYESRKDLIRERQRASWQQYARENAATLIEKNRQRRKENTAAEAEYRSKYRTLNAPKVAAKNQVWSHLLTGRIKKMPCEVCGHEKSDAHHDDYSRPLDVRWLCRKHHRLWHVENGEGKNGRSELQ